MGEKEFAVIPQIKRSVNTLTGKMFEYLASSPIEMGLVETVVHTLKAFWLPLAMHSVGVRGEELRKVAIWAIGVLESQILLIKRTCGLEEISQLVLVTPIVAQSFAGVVPPTSTQTQQQPNDSINASSSVIAPTQEDELGEDNFFDVDEDDPIAKAEIVADAGFYVE
jgi:hypothetical protein